MALPPIITNSPIFKALSGTPAEAQPRKTPSDKTEKAALPSAQDRVDLSDAALAKIEASRAGAIQTESSARETAGEVRTELERDTELTLG